MRPQRSVRKRLLVTGRMSLAAVQFACNMPSSGRLACHKTSVMHHCRVETLVLLVGYDRLVMVVGSVSFGFVGLCTAGLVDLYTLYAQRAAFRCSAC